MDLCNNIVYFLLYIFSFSLCIQCVHNIDQSEHQRSSIYDTNGRKITLRQVPQGVVKNAPDYIRQWGYPVEIHETTTEDGYILTLIRVPYGKNRNAPRRKPILFHHGLLCDGGIWILNEPEKILILQLADLGFDIWLASARGTRYSRRHTRFTVKDKAFFKYSVDDIANYDVKAEIDYVLEMSGARKIFFIGHSMGGLVFHMLMSTFPEYNQKISLMIGLAPGVYTKHLTGIIKLVVASLGPLTQIGVGVISYGAGEFPSPFLGNAVQIAGMAVCGWRPAASTLCNFIANILLGAAGPNNMGYPKWLTFFPSPTSERVIRHFLQLIKTGKFEHYDFGRSENMKVYGTATPPLYYLKDTTAPVALFYGETDSLVPPKDVLRMQSELPNVVFSKGLERKFNHGDFFLADDGNELLHKCDSPTTEILKEK